MINDTAARRSMTDATGADYCDQIGREPRQLLWHDTSLPSASFCAPQPPNDAEVPGAPPEPPAQEGLFFGRA